ncbi:hypothetical protein FF38_11096 [Lucilia cuprina]|uniref:Uncharacterized protein n=1 Tax=Lucilia cuprina TaxID=7375 RepID=A0A0L0CJH3_LUCCU|nr:hypothetical protein FF38_11096 [Lucilia cuprina]
MNKTHNYCSTKLSDFGGSSRIELISIGISLVESRTNSQTTDRLTNQHHYHYPQTKVDNRQRIREVPLGRQKSHVGSVAVMAVVARCWGWYYAFVLIFVTPKNIGSRPTLKCTNTNRKPCAHATGGTGQRLWWHGIISGSLQKTKYNRERLNCTVLNFKSRDPAEEIDFNEICTKEVNY